MNAITESAPIQAVPVQRDESGHWAHPDIPPFDEGQDAEYSAWLATNGLEITYTTLEGDPDHPLHDAYFGDGDCDISSWTPAAPEGAGWFTLSIHESEDGPVWVWARPTPETAAA